MVQVVEEQLAMVKDLFKEQQAHLDYFFEHLDMERLQGAFDLFKACEGMLFFCGVGKSGIVANKIAMTMISTGTKAYSLAATDAMHGDVGIVGSKDIFVLLSKSGETEELLNLVPAIRNKGATIVAVVCQESSRLSKAADHTVVLPLEKELCPFNLAPTTSPTIQMIFGDVLAVALMRERQYSLEEYARNHPAGQIGKRATLKVSDLMITGEGVPICKPESLLKDEIDQLSEKRCGCLIVVDEDMHLVGIFTDGDLRRSLQSHEAGVLDCTIGELMSPKPRWIGAETQAWEALKLMESDQKRPIMVLPVIEKGQVVGILKMHDLIQSGL